MEPSELKGKAYLEWAKTHPDEHNARMREQAKGLEQEAQLDAAGNKALEGLMAAKGQETEIVKLFGKVDVLVYSTMDGETEKMTMRVLQESLKLQNESGGDFFMVVKEMAEICAKMCVEDPYNTPKLWEMYYEQKGSTHLMEILYTIMGPHERNIDRIRSFRDNKPGKKPGNSV